MSDRSDLVCIWDVIAPAGDPEWALINTREHLVEHMHILGPGAMPAGRIYMQGQGTLPAYLKIYEIRSIDLQLSPIFKEASDAPRRDRSPRQIAARVHKMDGIKHNCRLLAQKGGGIGGAAAALIVTLTEPASRGGAAMESLCDQLVRRAPITGARLGLSDLAARGAPALRADASETEPTGVLLLESYSRFELAGILADVSAWIVHAGMAERTIAASHYALGYYVSASEDPALVRLRY